MPCSAEYRFRTFDHWVMSVLSRSLTMRPVTVPIRSRDCAIKNDSRSGLSCSRKKTAKTPPSSATFNVATSRILIHNGR